jgi:hypothetical protein
VITKQPGIGAEVLGDDGVIDDGRERLDRLAERVKGTSARAIRGLPPSPQSELLV